MTPKYHPVILCILDGWGIGASTATNGIEQARTPVWDRWMRDYPHAQLQASEEFVGLPEGQMGNSEVGHMTIGSGRVVLQELPRITQALAEGTVENLLAFQTFIQKLKVSQGTCHLMGLMSPGGVHSHQDHLTLLAKLIAGHDIPVKIHAFLDGRDTPPQSAAGYLEQFMEAASSHPLVQLATFGGRYFAMDRDKRWDRIAAAYGAVVFGKGLPCDGPVKMLHTFYHHNEGDEFIPPHVLPGYNGMKDGDGLMMANFRADRVRQLLTALLDPDFTAFDRGTPIQFAATLGMGEYSEDLSPLIPPLFEKDQLENTLGAVVAHAGLKQLRIAETEKYAHVTFFFNGGREELFPGEDRVLVQSPHVATYDLQPEMSALEVTDKVIEAIKSDQYALIVINYANTDMVGHTGVQEAIVKAVETVDLCLGRLEQAALQAGYSLLVTADHGNAEQMIDETTGAVHTAHTCNPVPIVVVNHPKIGHHLKNGSLYDIAPTVLEIMGLEKPREMTGESLIG